MAQPVQITPELLGAHASSLRALVRQILSDEHATEDVLQETWLTALRRPPRHGQRLGGWLSTVARTLALKRLRGERRRADREEACARPEETPELALERAQALRRLTDAVLRLEEPFRTAVLLRFFEDLPPRAIAQRLDVPVATVKSRLGRGLKRLREDLHEELGDGSWVPGLLLLTGFEPSALVPAPLAPGATGAPAAPVVLGWSATAAVAAGALALWIGLARDDGAASSLGAAQAPPAELTARAEGGGEGLVQEEGAAGAPHAQATERRPVEGAAEAAGEAAAPSVLVGAHRFRLVGTVLDAEDRPRAGVPVEIAPAGLEPLRVTETDADGHFVVEWTGDLPTSEVDLRLDGGGGRALAERMTLTAGVSRELRIGLHDGPSRGAHVVLSRVAEREEVPPTGSLVLSGNLSPPTDLTAFVEADLGKFSLADEPGAATGVPRTAHRSDACELVSAGVFFGGEVVRVSRSRVDVSFEESLRGSLEPVVLEITDRVVTRTDLMPRRGRTLRGHVLRADGTPAVDALVTARVPGSVRSASRRTDSEGRFVLTSVPDGELELLAGGGLFGQAARHVGADEGQELTWNPWLDRGIELRGRLVDESGSVLARRRVDVVVETRSGVWRDTARTDDEGRFCVPGLAPGRARIEVLEGDGAELLPFFVADVPAGDLGDVVVPAGKGTGSVRCTVPPGSRARLLQLATGRVAPLSAHERDEDDGAPRSEARLDGIVPGAYVLEVGTDLGGYAAIGPFEIRAEDVLELGDVEPPRAARLELSVGELSPGLRIELWRRGDVIALAGAFERERPSRIDVAAGAHLLRLRGPGGSLAELSLDLEAGMATSVSLAAGASAFVEGGVPRPLSPEELAGPACARSHR